MINYKEYTIPLDSEKGIATLDGWVEFWSNVLRGISQHTKFIQADLSGGFDTRVSFAILLHSGIDLDKIRINSFKGTVHTLKEDYEIASQIASYYGFKLNQLFPDQQFLNYNISDCFNIDLYGNQPFSNLSRLFLRKSIEKQYRLGGMSGETLRYRWQITYNEFINFFAWKVKPYSPSLSDKIFDSVKKFLDSGLHAVCNKHKIQDIKTKGLAQYLYHETWSRHHFGKETLCHNLVNVVRLSPALDPLVRTLRLETAQCPDANLLMALLFARYAPPLLKFPIDLNRSIAPETIEYAQNLNARFPRPLVTNNTKWGGDYSTYNRATCKPRKSLQRAGTIPTFRAA